MKLVNSGSLAKTIDNISNAVFINEKIKKEDRKKAAVWIASRQGLKRSYAGMFAPTEKDFQGIKFFTGENIKSGAAIAHILGEESLRALKILGLPNKTVKTAYVTANQNMTERILASKCKGRY